MSTPVVEAQIRIAANPNSVYHALTDEAGLRTWFAEDASVDIDQGRYEFSGRYTLGTPSVENPGIRLLQADPGQRLVYTWPLGGVSSMVRIELQDNDASSVLTLRHSNLGGAPPWQVECFWSMALENLRAYVERGAAGLRFDYTNIPHGDVSLTAEIDADPESVFDALINPGQLDRYMSNEPAHVEPRAGGKYDVGWGSDGPVKILDLIPGERLSYTWRSRDQNVAETVVTWSLEDTGGRTRLTLVHSGFAPDRAGMDYGIGWLDYLNRIKQMVEVGESWRRPSIEVVEDRGIRDAGLYLPSAGIHAAVASAPSRTHQQSVR